MNLSDMEAGSIYKIRDWIAAGDDHRPSHWNSLGNMDKWCGKIVTISSIAGHKIRVSEDNRKWLWNSSDFESAFETWRPTKKGAINPNRAFKALKRG